MYSAEQRTGIQIPSGVKSSEIMNSLAIGHGYCWTVLTRTPLLVAHGAPTIGNMPELLLTGNKALVLAGGDTAYVERIQKVLEMLQRQSHRIQFSNEEE